MVKNPPVRSFIKGSGSDDPTAADAHHPCMHTNNNIWRAMVLPWLLDQAEPVRNGLMNYVLAPTRRMRCGMVIVTMAHGRHAGSRLQDPRDFG